MPEEILTDNGKVFTGRFGRNADRGALRQDLPGERHHPPPHRSPIADHDRQDRALPPDAADRVPHWPGLRLDRRCPGRARRLGRDYNTDRPHQGMAWRPRTTAFAGGRVNGPGLDPDLRALAPDRTGDDWISRTVSLNGTISVANQVFSVGKHRSERIIDVRVTEKLLEAWDGMELLKTVLRTSKGVIRKKRAEVHVSH